MRISTNLINISLTVGGLFMAGCAGNVTSQSGALTLPVASSVAGPSVAQRLKPRAAMPILVTLDLTTGDLEGWPIRAGSNGSPQPISPSLGVYSGYAMAANGNVVAIANSTPAQVVTYDVTTSAKRVLPDPFGQPFDIAIGRSGSLFALDINGVTAYRIPGVQPARLTCSYVNSGVAIAVDDENDVFVNGYGPNGFMGVVEYPFGKRTCAPLHLRAEKGYIAGVGVDPKTDDLIVVDDPDLCAGGLEGRMIVYPKPYDPKTGRFHNLKSNYCAGTVRLDAQSRNIFVADSTISAGFPLIDQLTYPGSRAVAVYSGGSFGGFTTIPNTLPN